MAKLAFLIPFFPILGFLINGLFGRRVGKPLGGIIASAAVVLSFVTGLMLTYTLRITGNPGTYHFFEWIHVDKFQVNFAYHVDNLALVMILTVSGVSALIHIYSIGYMKHDRDYTRYFSYMNLFTAMMLILVMAENLLVMFIGWEGVGLCSYLLIGFWFERESAANAGRKAFIVNRIGDAGFIIGMLLLYNHFGTLSIQPILQKAPEYFVYGSTVLTAITLLLFVGATGKSAQIPLHVWLPDAMEGPTPVSALIHAATMVTAGVYMVCRLDLLYLMSPVTMTVICVISALTAFIAASIALAQYDIKRVLAYSTISQLGYMFLACSVGAFPVAIFHLVTHAFFKALLFLCSGAVIHGLGDEQDMRRMGGLAKSMPVTWITFMIGTMAIAGFPFLAGFFSKDMILESTFTGFVFKNQAAGVIGYLTAILTAFYMYRLYYRIFRGRYYGRGDIKPHDAPVEMAFPLVILAFLSVFAGFLGWPLTDSFGKFLEPVFGQHMESIAGFFGREASNQHSIPWLYWMASFICFLAGWFIAWVIFVAAPRVSNAYKEAFHGFFKTLNNKYYVDEFYHDSLVKPGKSVFTWFWLWIDLAIIDGFVNELGVWSENLGRISSKLTTGYIRNYALYMLIGLIILILLIQR